MSGSDIWLVGCGTMGGAMLRRWLAAGIPADRVTVIDPAGDAEVPDGVRHVTDVPNEPAPALAVLAVKPQQLDTVVANLAAWQGEPPLLLSILAGVEAATLSARLAVTHVVRAMPNLPVLIGHGVVALWTDSLNESQRDDIESLVRPLGTVEWLAEESQFHAVTALAGSGPGFVLRIVEAMAAAGTRVGLPADQALRLAIATVEGSAALAAATGEAPRALANRVASKGGTTQAGLDVLDSDGVLNRLFADTIAAAARRSRELAEATR